MGIQKRKKHRDLKSLVAPKNLSKLAGQAKYDRGLKYYNEGRVLCVRKKGNAGAEALVQGEEKYGVNLSQKDRRLDAVCACPSFENDGFCKHCVAAATAYAKDGEYETLTETYVRKLFTAIRKASKDVRENPGISLNDEERYFEIGKIKKAESGFKYIATDKGIVSWGQEPVFRLLEGFDLLSVKKGFQIDGYYNFDGMGGNFKPVAFPARKKIPDWKDVRGNPYFQPDLLSSELDANIEKYIIPNGTPASSFQKTLFINEVYELGAFWHGCSNWRLGGIVLDRKEVEKRMLAHGTHVIKKAEIPVYFNPRVSAGEDGKTTVSFYFFSESSGARVGLFRFEFTHMPDGNMEKTGDDCLIDMGLGAIP